MSLKGKKVVMIIASDKFRDEEYQEPRKLLEKEGAEVVVASSTLNFVRGMISTKVKPDILLSQIRPQDFDAVIFVGGSGAQEYYLNQVAHTIAKDTVNAKKVLGAICIAPVILANAGVLTGRKATVFPSEANKLKARGIQYIDNDVVEDEKVITGRGPDAAKKFGEAIVRALSK